MVNDNANIRPAIRLEDTIPEPGPGPKPKTRKSGRTKNVPAKVTHTLEADTPNNVEPPPNPPPQDIEKVPTPKVVERVPTEEVIEEVPSRRVVRNASTHRVQGDPMQDLLKALERQRQKKRRVEESLAGGGTVNVNQPKEVPTHVAVKKTAYKSPPPRRESLPPSSSQISLPVASTSSQPFPDPTNPQWQPATQSTTAEVMTSPGKCSSRSPTEGGLLRLRIELGSPEVLPPEGVFASPPIPSEPQEPIVAPLVLNGLRLQRQKKTALDYIIHGGVNLASNGGQLAPVTPEVEVTIPNEHQAEPVSPAVSEAPSEVPTELVSNKTAGADREPSMTHRMFPDNSRTFSTKDQMTSIHRESLYTELETATRLQNTAVYFEENLNDLSVVEKTLESRTRIEFQAMILIRQMRTLIEDGIERWVAGLKEGGYDMMREELEREWQSREEADEEENRRYVPADPYRVVLVLTDLYRLIRHLSPTSRNVLGSPSVSKDKGKKRAREDDLEEEQDDQYIERRAVIPRKKRMRT